MDVFTRYSNDEFLNERNFMFVRFGNELKCLNTEEKTDDDEGIFDEKQTRSIDRIRYLNKDSFYYKNTDTNCIEKVLLKYSSVYRKKIYMAPANIELVDFFVD